MTINAKEALELAARLEDRFLFPNVERENEAAGVIRSLVAEQDEAQAKLAQVREVRAQAIHAEFCEEGYVAIDPETEDRRVLGCDCWVRDFDAILAQPDDEAKESKK